MGLNDMLDQEIDTFVSAGAYAAALMIQTSRKLISEGLTIGIPSDPDVATAQWHLTGTWGVHADKVWPDYTGAGIKVAVLDDGFEYTHSELSANYRQDLDWDTRENDSDAMAGGSDFHGTAVMGTILADDNGFGTVGVAFDAQGIGIRQGFGANGDLTQTITGFQYALAQNVDVINNSWGYTTPFADDAGKEFYGPDIYQVTGAIQDLADFGRDGDGTNVVFASGNARLSGDNVNYHNVQNSPYVITVAAIDSSGVVGYFSTPGAAILVSAGGVNDWTIDRSGSAGYASGNYTNFSGTSASTPVVSGVVALMLEANPDLGWRDVQQILAYSTQFNDPTSSGWQYNGAGNWNGGGLHFSHDYGYGAVDARAAVRLAEHWAEYQTSANMTTFTTATSFPSLSIPTVGTITSTINVAQDISVEHVLINLDLSHSRAGDLVVTLISPEGTESILVNHPSNGSFTGIYGISGIDFQLATNAHLGEHSVGNWTLKVQDTVSGNSGTLNAWNLTFMGEASDINNQYIYTNDLVNFNASAAAARNTINDTNGGIDTVNFSTVTYDVHMSMIPGVGQTVFMDHGGNTYGNSPLYIPAGSLIENAVMGDGDDYIFTNDADNTVYGGRGNDFIINSVGNDYFDGGAGNDTARFSEFVNNYTFDFSMPLTLVSMHTNPMYDKNYGTDTWFNFEYFSFSDGTFTLSQLEDFLHPGLGTIDLAFRQSDGATYTYHSKYAESKTINGDAFGLVSGDYVQLERDENGLIVTYLNPQTPKTLQVTGSDHDDTMTINGLGAAFIINIDGGLGNDTIAVKNFGTATLAGGDGIDTVSFYNAASAVNVSLAIAGLQNTGAGSYTITGFENLTGSVFGDTLYGNANANVFKGEAGNDIYNWGNGSGADSIMDTSGIDKILISGLMAERLSFAVDNNNLVILSLLSPSDSLTLLNQLGVSAPMVETMQFADGFTVNLTDYSHWKFGTSGINAMYGDTIAGYKDVIFGGDGNDTIKGYNGDDTLSGDAGNDKLYGGNGNDIMDGGSGNDMLFGEAGNDLMYGGGGNDTFDGGAGEDTVSYIGYTDAITVITTSTGYSVQHGLFTDTLTGIEHILLPSMPAPENNIYTWGNGSGLTTINDNGGNDRIAVFGLMPEQLAFSISGDDMMITSSLSSSDRLTVTGQFAASGVPRIEQISFADGFTLSLTDYSHWKFGTSGIDPIYGDSIAAGYKDVMFGGAGNDTLKGYNGDDTLSGDSGNDKLYGGNGNDTLHGGSGMDTLYGEAGNDILFGGTGSDTLTGGAGNDRFMFDPSTASIDTITDFNPAEDTLDFSKLLTSYDPLTSAIADFVQITDGGADSIVKVDIDGAANGINWVQVATLTGVAGLTDEQALLAAGHLAA